MVIHSTDRTLDLQELNEKEHAGSRLELAEAVFTGIAYFDWNSKRAHVRVPDNPLWRRVVETSPNQIHVFQLNRKC